MTETWTFNPDKSEGSVTGRTLQPWYKKVNPIWWLLNDGEPWPPDWYLPGRAYWVRTLYWYLRNPFENFGDYVIGVADRNYTVTGTSPVTLTAWNDVGQIGWKYSIIRIGWLRLPFVSYAGTKWMFYAGWQYGGFFGFKVNLLNSPIQGA